MSDMLVETEKLEAELSELSARIASDRPRFEAVSGELRRRREGNIGTTNDQPEPKVVTHEEQLLERARMIATLTTKLVSMEAEQAKLVVEAEIAKAGEREAMRRLSIVTRHAKFERLEEMQNDLNKLS